MGCVTDSSQQYLATFKRTVRCIVGMGHVEVCHLVPVRVFDTLQTPSGNIAGVVCQPCLSSLSVIVPGAVLVGNFPIIVLRSGTSAQDAAEGAFDTGVESGIPYPRNPGFPFGRIGGLVQVHPSSTVDAGSHQDLPVEHIRLGLQGVAVQGDTPAGVHTDFANR